MRYPVCFAQDSKVVDAHLAGDSDQIRHHSQGSACTRRFTAGETAGLNLPNAIKNDGRHKAFAEQKLHSGRPLR